MRSDTDVPVLHCGVAARAIPRAMVGIDRMYFDSFGVLLLLLLMREENRAICEERLVMQFACYFL